MKKTKIASAIAVCIAGVGTQYAAAQTTAKLEEVVVTAERREASNQNVPISVTAVDMRQLDAKQVVDVVSLTKIVPGMTAKPTLTPLEISVAIRGVTQLIPSVNVDPAIGTYVDGVYNVINAGSNNAMIDMERVEVLKGPQGTLFGRNTIGGAINITTAKPTDEFGGYVDVALGNYDAQTYTGMINGALVPGSLNGRLVFQHTEHNGYGTNRTLDTDMNTLNQDYVRGSLVFLPTDGWEIIASGFYTEAEGHSAPNRVGYLDSGSLLGLLPLFSANPTDLIGNYVDRGDFQDDFSQLQSSYALRQYGGTATVTGELSDAVTLKSITAYVQTDYNTIADLDGTPYVGLELINYPIEAKQYSQELQFFGDAMDQRLSWIAGAYYFGMDGSQLSMAHLLGPLVPTNLITGPTESKNTSTSAFAQFTYELMPKLRATLGARYVLDKREVTYRDFAALQNGVPGTYAACSLANAPFDPNFANCRFSDDVDYDYVPWTAGLDYKLNDDMLVYAKVSKGYRSGAFGLSGPAAQPAGNGVTQPEADAATAAALDEFAPVEPEDLISYEIGGKFEFFDQRLRVNTAAYWSEYNNIQMTTNIQPCVACAVIGKLENSGKAEIYGGEIEVAALIENLLLEASVGYTHPEYKEGPLVGEDLINISDLNYALGATYPISFSAGELTVNANYSYRSEAVFYTLSPGLPEAARDDLTQDGYGTVDARVSFDFTNLPLTISLFGQNLTDEEYISSAQSFAPPLGYVSAFSGVPRTYGASLRYKY